jgi:formyl-CoA transferase
MDNRNKRSIALNLKSAAARPVLERLVKWADELANEFSSTSACEVWAGV